MNTLQYRIKAKVIGYVDLVISSMGLLLVLLLAVLNAGATLFLTDNQIIAFMKGNIPDAPPFILGQRMGIIFWTCWIIIGILGTLAVLQVRAAVNLVNSTEVGRDAWEAQGKAMFWRNFNIVLLIFVLACPPQLANLALISFVITRAVCIYIVWRYIGELGQSIVKAKCDNIPCHEQGTGSYKNV